MVIVLQLLHGVFVTLTILSFGYYYYAMNDVQTLIKQLEDKGWTLAALADEMGLSSVTVNRWKAGARIPQTEVSIRFHLTALLERKRVPRKRRSKGRLPIRWSRHVSGWLSGYGHI